MKYYLTDDAKCYYRDAVIFDEEELEEATSNYSGYYVVDIVEAETLEEAEKICNDYNNYEGEPDVELSCCSSGCTMTAYEYNHWNGKCAYMGQEDDED